MSGTGTRRRVSLIIFISLAVGIPLTCVVVGLLVPEIRWSTPDPPRADFLPAEDTIEAAQYVLTIERAYWELPGTSATELGLVVSVTNRLNFELAVDCYVIDASSDLYSSNFMPDFDEPDRFPFYQLAVEARATRRGTLTFYPTPPRHVALQLECGVCPVSGLCIRNKPERATIPLVDK